MTDFNFLRIKWPKLAAIAADASRLVEVSPAAAISTMQNFCEWAADIAMDLNDIRTQSGITQQEKIETLKAIGHAPTDIIGRFQNVLLAGGRRLYRQNEDVEEARTCIEDIYEIGRWLNKEADRSGWPPKSDYYRPMVSPIGVQPEGGYTEGGGIGDRLKDFQPFLIFGVAALVIIAVAVFLVIMVSNGGKQPVTKPTTISITPTPSVSAVLVTEPATASPTPAPAKTAFLDAMNITCAQPSVYKKAWNFHSGGTPPPLTISDKHYANGLGIYIPSSAIQKTQGTMNITCKLDDEYDTLTFDLGVDSNLQYEAGHGQFRVQIYLDSTHVTPAYDSGLNSYDFTQMGQAVNIKGATTLIIKLTEVKGTKKGTINVVMGNCLLTKGGDGTPVDTSSASSTDSASASVSPSPSPSPTDSNAGGGGGSPDASPPVDTEQALPPG